MILFISYGHQRLAVTVQPSRQPSSQPSDQTSALLFGHNLGKALTQIFGGCA
jgi:hypothetical protein